MATKATAPAEEPEVKTNEDYVPYFAPFVGVNGDTKPIFCAVNGDTIRIKRGEQVMIKRKFFNVLMAADKQAIEAARYSAAAQAAGAKAFSQF